MRKLVLLGILCSISTHSVTKAQEMHPKKLYEVISKVADTLTANGQTIQFSYKERPLILVLSKINEIGNYIKN
jgi:hypothetical protein